MQKLAWSNKMLPTQLYTRKLRKSQGQAVDREFNKNHSVRRLCGVVDLRSHNRIHTCRVAENCRLKFDVYKLAPRTLPRHNQCAQPKKTETEHGVSVVCEGGAQAASEKHGHRRHKARRIDARLTHRPCVEEPLWGDSTHFAPDCTVGVSSAGTRGLRGVHPPTGS